MPTNLYIIFFVALIPMLVGSIYYHPKVMGSRWMEINGFTMESLKGANMPIIFGLAYLFSLMLSFVMPTFVIHQSAFFSLQVPEVLEAGSKAEQAYQQYMAAYGHLHRSFTHGAILSLSIFVALPIIGTNALFERRGASYIFIHWLYWAMSLTLMGGVICKFISYS